MSPDSHAPMIPAAHRKAHSPNTERARPKFKHMSLGPVIHETVLWPRAIPSLHLPPSSPGRANGILHRTVFLKKLRDKGSGTLALMLETTCGQRWGPLTVGAVPPLFPSSFEVPESQTHTGLQCKHGSSQILSIIQNPCACLPGHSKYKFAHVQFVHASSLESPELSEP